MITFCVNMETVGYGISLNVPILKTPVSKWFTYECLVLLHAIVHIIGLNSDMNSTGNKYFQLVLLCFVDIL